MTQADPHPHSPNRMPGSATSVAHVACLNCRCSVEWLMLTVCVCEWGDLWVYLLLVWFYELSVKLRQAHAHSYWDRDTQSQHCSAALCYVCWPNCLWWRQSSVNQSVAALGLWLSLCLCLSRSLRASHCLPRFLCLLLKHGFGAGSGSGPVYVSLVVRMSSSGQLSRCLSVNMPFAFAISQFSLSLSLSLSLDFWAVWLMLAHGQCRPSRSRSRSRLGSSRDNHFGKLLMNDLLA